MYINGVYKLSVDKSKLTYTVQKQDSGERIVNELVTIDYKEDGIHLVDRLWHRLEIILNNGRFEVFNEGKRIPVSDLFYDR